MVGFTLVSLSYYYLRSVPSKSRPPVPVPFPPDHRRAGERWAIHLRMSRNRQADRQADRFVGAYRHRCTPCITAFVSGCEGPWHRGVAYR